MLKNMLNESIPGSKSRLSVLEKTGELQRDFQLLHDTLTIGIKDFWSCEEYTYHTSVEKELHEEAVRVLEGLRSGTIKK